MSGICDLLGSKETEARTACLAQLCETSTKVSDELKDVLGGRWVERLRKVRPALYTRLSATCASSIKVEVLSR